MKGDKAKEIVTTEQEISVDYGYFGENTLNEIPFETRPVYDPTGILTRELESRYKNLEIERAIHDIVDRSQDIFTRSTAALERDPYSALVHLHLATTFLATKCRG